MSLVIALGLLSSVVASGADEFFSAKIEPILKERCYECHSHAKKMKGGLTLDSKSGWEQGGDNGAALVPGKPDESLLIKMVLWIDDDHQMPPKEKISEAEIALLEEWVKRGAPDPRVQLLKRPNSENWWSLKPLVKPPLPELTDKSVLHPVDCFIGAKLAEKKLAPSPPADPRTLLRRVYYDLHGLPPSLSEVEGFAKDTTPGTDHPVNSELRWLVKNGLLTMQPPLRGSTFMKAHHWMHTLVVASTLTPAAEDKPDTPRWTEDFSDEASFLKNWSAYGMTPDGKWLSGSGTMPHWWQIQDSALLGLHAPKTHGSGLQRVVSGKDVRQSLRFKLQAGGRFRYCVRTEVQRCLLARTILSDCANL